MSWTKSTATAEVVRRELEGIKPPKTCRFCPFLHDHSRIGTWCVFTAHLPHTCPVFKTWIMKRDPEEFPEDYDY